MQLSATLSRLTLAGALLLAGAGLHAQEQKNTGAEEEKKMERAKADVVTVKMTTSMGEITIELNQEMAPITVENFLTYVDNDFYDDTIFHRVIPNFMIQCGGFDTDFNQKQTRAQIKNEWRNGLKNDRGTLAMARLGNRPDSATSQFFINLSDNSFLDQPRDGAGYAVFGKVTDGMDVVDEIAGVRTTSKQGHQNVPVDQIVIEDIEVLDWK